MTESTRKLVAIMFTDIANYTGMMGADEDRAVHALELSRNVVRQQVAKHGGELLEEIGDGSLSSFGSAVNAVECAREIQQIVVAQSDFELRIGIHIGDVLISGHQVIGDGVNVASRIHGLADPGSICISDQVYHSVSNHPEFEPRLLGERHLKRVELPRS